MGIRKTVNKRIYDTKRWDSKRAYVLRRDGYMCRECARIGKHIPANTVHHIFPVEYFPEYQNEDWNLISVCAACHNEIHDRQEHTLSEKGIELLRRTARKKGIALPPGAI